MLIAKLLLLINRAKVRNDITTLASYDQHGSDSLFTHYMGLQGLLLNILQ